MNGDLARAEVLHRESLAIMERTLGAYYFFGLLVLMFFFLNVLTDFSITVRVCTHVYFLFGAFGAVV